MSRGPASLSFALPLSRLQGLLVPASLSSLPPPGSPLRPALARVAGPLHPRPASLLGRLALGPCSLCPSLAFRRPPLAGPRRCTAPPSFGWACPSLPSALAFSASRLSLNRVRPVDTWLRSARHDKPGIFLCVSRWGGLFLARVYGSELTSSLTCTWKKRHFAVGLVWVRFFFLYV